MANQNQSGTSNVQAVEATLKSLHAGNVLSQDHLGKMLAIIGDTSPKKREYLSVNELVATYHVSRPTLWRMVKSGKLRQYAFGGRKLFDVNDVESFIGRS